MKIIYGISNCDTVKKTQKKWLELGLEFQFVDYRKSELPLKVLKEWSSQVGWEALINKKSTTWRSLTEVEQVSITNEKSALKLLHQHPTLIKRPVIVSDTNQVISIGYNEAAWSGLSK